MASTLEALTTPLNFMPRWPENGKSHCLCRLLLTFPLCPRSDKKKAHRRIYNAIVSYVPQLSQLAEQPAGVTLQTRHSRWQVNICAQFTSRSTICTHTLTKALQMNSDGLQERSDNINSIKGRILNASSVPPLCEVTKAGRGFDHP